MRALGIIMDASGTVLGSSPVRVTSVQYRRTLDGVGQATVTIPAADKNAALFLTVRGRFTVKRPLPSGFMTDMFTESIITKLQTRDGPNGAEIVLNLLDKVSLLEDANTGIARKFKNVTLDSAMTTLLALSSGFTHSFVDAGLSTLTVSKRFDGVSVMDAMKDVLAVHGLHWYATGGTIYITSGGVVALGAMHNMHNIPATVGTSTFNSIIQEIKVEEDADGLVTKIVPLGKGDGDKALNLRLSTRTTPYTIQSETVNGRTQYFISDSTAVTSYGTITEIVKYDDIAPAEPGRKEKIEAANQLYDAAVVELERRKQVINRYTVTVRPPNTIYGAWGVARPSEKRRVIYKGYVMQSDGSKIDYLNVDSELWVIGVTETINLEGYSATVDLADYDVVPESAAGKLVSQIKQLKAGARLPDADTFYIATVQSTDATPNSIFIIDIPENSAMLVTGHVVAARSDMSAALGATFTAVFRRQTGGNVVESVDITTVGEDSAGAPTFAIGAHNADPVYVANFVYTGVAAQTWNWKATYRVIHLLD
jgi:hypothetical protein